jgi:ATP-dependent DNA ligase
MLARLAEDLPTGDGWLYEPKWDGFRALVHRRGARAEVVSRHGRSLTVAFEDVAEAAADALPDGCVVDGELVAPVEGGVLFDGLLRRLSGGGAADGTPAALIAFDLLQVGGADVTARPLSERRRALEALVLASGRVVVNLQTSDVHEAQAWLEGGALTGVEGVVAKRTSGRYQPGQRGWVKVKEASDCRGGRGRIPRHSRAPGAVRRGGETSPRRRDGIPRSRRTGADGGGAVAGADGRGVHGATAGRRSLAARPL